MLERPFYNSFQYTGYMVPIHVFSPLSLYNTCRSFLYYLDGVSLLLYRVPASFETRLDHITVGYGHALALSDDGMVFSWGVGSRGQLGHGDKETRRSPQLVESIRGNRITRYIDILHTVHHTASLITADLTHHCTPHSIITSHCTPHTSFLTAHLTHHTSFLTAHLTHHTSFLTAHLTHHISFLTAHLTHHTSFLTAHLTHHTSLHTSLITSHSSHLTPHRVECGGEFSVFVTDNGILMMCGHGDHGVQGHGDNNDCLKPKLVEDLLTQDVIQVHSHSLHLIIL